MSGAPSSAGAALASLLVVAAGGCGEPLTEPPPPDIEGFRADFLGEPFLDGDFDPMLFHRRHFADGEYRVIVQNGRRGERRLYRTDAFESFTLLEADWLPSEPVGGPHSFQDHVMLSDGTFVLYQNDGEGGTAVWTGPSLHRVRERLTVAYEDDGGAFYDRERDRIHLYTEARESQRRSSSDRLRHYAMPGDRPLSVVRHGGVLDGLSRSTGDVDVIRVGDHYFMFIDRGGSHPEYGVAVAWSADLHRWWILQSSLTAEVHGGDMVVVRHADHWHGMTEYSGPDHRGIGHWRIRAVR